MTEPTAPTRAEVEAAQQANDQRIRDLGSTNGTFVTRGGVTAKINAWDGPVAIRPGDTIRIGRTAIPWTTQR